MEISQATHEMVNRRNGHAEMCKTTNVGFKNLGGCGSDVDYILDCFHPGCELVVRKDDEQSPEIEEPTKNHFGFF